MFVRVRVCACVYVAVLSQILVGDVVVGISNSFASV